jgi:hypothetical protein
MTILFSTESLAQSAEGASETTASSSDTASAVTKNSSSAPVPTAEGTTPVSPSDGAGKQAANEVKEASPVAESDNLTERVEKLEQIVEDVRQENEALKFQMDSGDEDLMKQETDKQRELRIYGFMDVQWYKFLIKDDDNQNEGRIHDKNSFGMGHWNLFIEKQLSDHFRVLGEVRFLFQPYGEEISFGSSLGGVTTEYERANTKATDWVDAYYFDWGGIAIQRAFIEYKLNDYFGVQVGRFLTPYGVWNVDHASTVVIPAHRPFLSTAELVPEAQTGLQFFGRALPSGNFFIDYGLTLTNGRGPTTKLYDLDENKAMGLTLSLTYEGPVSVTVGSYLYIGEYTDTVRNITMDYQTFQMDWVEDTTVNYVEKEMSFSLKFEGGGFTLQGEFVRGLVEYQKGGRPLYFTNTFTGQDIYYPDYIQQAAYVLAAYRLPVKVIDLSPYYVYEYQDPPDTAALPIGHNWGGGINWRVTPSVVWKVEGLYHKQTEAIMGSIKQHYSLVTTQLAVSY